LLPSAFRRSRQVFLLPFVFRLALSAFRISATLRNVGSYPVRPERHTII